VNHVSDTVEDGIYLQILKDIYDVSCECNSATYVWGGFTLDVLEGRFLRKHHDLDGFTLNLLDIRQEASRRYADRGYLIEYSEDFDILAISRDGYHAAFNRLEVDGETAMWRHIGNAGTVYFPARWLDPAPRDFCGVPVLLAGAEFDYVLKTNVGMLNPQWVLRDKDRAAVARLEEILATTGSEPEEFLRHVWSYNPFWARRGYPEYAMPTVARPLQPLR
jgi:hypothetical protein